MPYDTAPLDAHMVALMGAALETAWMAASLGVPGLSHADRAKMERAISVTAASGERNFMELQQAAFDALGVTQVKPVDRRQNPTLRLVATDRRRST